MKIRVAHIPAEGLQMQESYEPAGLDMERADIHLKEPFQVDAHVVLAGDELVVQAEISAALECDCARCLKRFRSVIYTKALYNYPVRPGDVVDITDDVRQEVILAFPMRPLCRPDCQVVTP